MSLHIKSKFTIKLCVLYLTNFFLNMNIWYLSRSKRVSIFNSFYIQYSYIDKKCK